MFPLAVTAMVGTVTYPVAVRIVRGSPFRLRGFYAIHASIAPVLALVHLNVFAAVNSYMFIKDTESKIWNQKF